MTVIAWKDNALAADNGGRYSGGMIVKSEKIVPFVLDNVKLALATTGDAAGGRAMRQWYMDGARPEWWPKSQGGESGACLIVARRGKVLVFSNSEHYNISQALGKVRAWGCGAEIAMGAMMAGASAYHAVEIANKLHESCGPGVTVVHV